MKKFILLAFISGIFALAHAQQFSRGAFSIGPDIGLPQQSVYNFGYGASAKVEVPLVNRVSLSFTGGYSRFSYKGAIVSAFGSQAPSTFVPLKGGVRYGTGGGLYLEAEAGDIIETTTSFTNDRRNLFGFSVGPGFLFHLSEKQAIDLGFRYEQWSKNLLKQTGIRVAYRVGW